jgi:hypothetical protein
MIEKPQITIGSGIVAEHAPLDVRAFQMLRPSRRTGVNALVHRLQRGQLRRGDVFVRDDQEIGVAVLIKISDSERALNASRDFHGLFLRSSGFFLRNHAKRRKESTAGKGLSRRAMRVFVNYAKPRKKASP